MLYFVRTTWYHQVQRQQQAVQGTRYAYPPLLLIILYCCSCSTFWFQHPSPLSLQDSPISRPFQDLPRGGCRQRGRPRHRSGGRWEPCQLRHHSGRHRGRENPSLRHHRPGRQRRRGRKRPTRRRCPSSRWRRVTSACIPHSDRDGRRCWYSSARLTQPCQCRRRPACRHRRRCQSCLGNYRALGQRRGRRDARHIFCCRFSKNPLLQCCPCE